MEKERRGCEEISETETDTGSEQRDRSQTWRRRRRHLASVTRRRHTSPHVTRLRERQSSAGTRRCAGCWRSDAGWWRLCPSGCRRTWEAPLAADLWWAATGQLFHLIIVTWRVEDERGGAYRNNLHGMNLLDVRSYSSSTSSYPLGSFSSLGQGMSS